MVIRYTVPASEDGRILKNVLRDSLRLSTALLRRLKAADALSVGGERSRADRVLHTGDELMLLLTEDAPAFPPEAAPGRIGRSTASSVQRLRHQRHAPRTFTLSAKEAGNLMSGVYAAFGQSFQKRDK